MWCDAFYFVVGDGRSSVSGRLLLRDARHRDQDSIHSLQLEALDGIVGLSIPVAIAMSPVLATALSGQFVESRSGTYALKSHSVNILNFAIDYMCGDVRRQD